MTAIALLTSGGDAPGMNAAIRAITKVAASHGVPTWGVEQGFDGLIDGAFRPLSRRNKMGEPAPIHEVESEGGQGGTILGSSRSPRFYERTARVEAARQLEEYSITGVVVIGGNGSLAGVHALQAETEVPIVGIPASIDNDIGLTREALGVDSALNTIVEACDNISDTARSHHRAFIVEVMGRQSGYLAMAAAVATAADAVLMPERPHTRDDLINSVVDCIRPALGRPGTRPGCSSSKPKASECRPMKSYRRLRSGVMPMGPISRSGERSSGTWSAAVTPRFGIASSPAVSGG